MTKTMNKLNDKTRVTITKHNLKILSWNIQSANTIEGNKFDIPSFQKTINSHDFACLQEIRKDVHFKGYRSICNTRKGNKSGGVGILIKNELAEGTELVKNEQNTDYLICRLDKDFFNLTTDLFIVNVYIKPYNSSSSNLESNGLDTIKIIESTINDLREHGEVILCGDFNARIGNQSGMISHDSCDFIPLPCDYEPDEYLPRNSLDTSTNTYGTHFINLVKNNQLLILNGRTLGDFQGNFTSIQKNGCSVIDYIAVTRNNNLNINYFKVLDFTEHSDHRPLSVELKCNRISVKKYSPMKECYQPAPCRFIFNEENKDNFFHSQTSTSSSTLIRELQSQIDSLSNSSSNCNTEVQINVINDKFAGHIRTMASECFKQTKPSRDSLKPNNPWFNWKARSSKRELRKAAKTTSHFPDSDFIRYNFYLVKGSYKRLISNSRNEFFTRMNRDIEGGKVLNWQAFKKLKHQKQDKADFDSYDMDKFESFFQNLYSDSHKTISPDQKNKLLEKADIIDQSSPNSDILNKVISINEVNSAIKSVKTGKASSDDLISNEILKCLDSAHRSLLTNIFNVCFTNRVYPWNCSIISPLHKKGSKSDPDNYRAVAVSSVLGKLFSTILLERLIEFRSTNCPDPPNQLGFTKKAQTYDHILTMKTIASKYKRLKKPVFAVFVDFKKAFDSVCRQALFFKLAKIGVTGNFYGVLRNMYSNSFAHIKLSGHLSNKFVVAKGTEQGHPLSPDLFKIFVADLSQLLDFPNCPELSKTPISHLLWADDLILLSLDAKTAQLQIDALGKFCRHWGIEINELKTQIVVFGEKFVSCDAPPHFTLDGKPLQIVDSYCYLGIILHKTGSVSIAQQDLKAKSMRAFFGLKRSVMRSKISFKSLMMLFDSLIKPIVLYGAPIWTPSSSINKSISKFVHADKVSPDKLFKAIGRSVQEKVHLSYLKWALGVHRKASNVGVWGESGRVPLIYQSIRLTLNYFKRVSSLDQNTFVSAAFREQKSMKLPWYQNIKPLLKLDEIYSMDHVTAFKTIQRNRSTKVCARNQATSILLHFKKVLANTQETIPENSKQFRVNRVMEILTNHFKICWEQQKSTSSKLSFYHSIKKDFTCTPEPYLNLCKGFSRRYSTTQLRISAHDLEIERGRYKNTKRADRTCAWCQTCMGINIVEDESHVLFHCDLYSLHRLKLISNLNKALSIATDSNAEPAAHITSSNLQSHLMAALSPNIPVCNNILNDFVENIHPISANCQQNSEYASKIIQRQSYAANCVSTFILRCFEERKKFVEDQRAQKNMLVNFQINLVRDP